MASVNEATDVKSVVLVGIDFSPQSRDALKAAARMTPTGGELHLVHVMSPIGDAFGTPPADKNLGIVTQIDEARDALDRIALEVQPSVARVAGHLRSGSPDVEIAQLASDLGADLIVVGSHGHRGLERLLLGSVAESLVHHAPCPVLAWRARTIPIWNQIAPPCADCVAVQKVTQRANLWCERHSQRHARAHTYYEVPPSYGIGAQTFR